MSSNDERLRAGRALYEDEETYRRAIVKLKLEELKAKREKAFLKQYRARKRRIVLRRASVAARGTLNKAAKHVSRKRLMYGGSALATVVFIAGGVMITNHKSDETAKTLGVAAVQPDFSPALPSGNKENVVTTENNQHKIVSFRDNYDGTQILISQQRLPDDFKTNPTAVEQLAKDQLKATETIDTPKGKIYTATNTTGQQWAVMAYQDLLIFFETSKKLDASQWERYVSNLKIQ